MQIIFVNRRKLQRWSHLLWTTRLYGLELAREGSGERKSEQDVFGQQEISTLLHKSSTLTPDQSFLKPGDPEGKDTPVITSQEKGAESTPVYEHSIASTPSLVFGGDSSPGSSLRKCS